MAESFPCIICGGVLQRINPDAEGQPDDGLMCLTHGNYGSTVFDPDDLSYLRFNICDECMVTAAEQGRVMVTRSYIPVECDGLGRVGRTRAERAYIPWRKGMPNDGAVMELDLFEDFDALMATGKLDLHVPADQIKAQLAKNRTDGGGDENHGK